MSTPTIKREIFSVLLRVIAVVATIAVIISLLSFTYSSFGMIGDGECSIAVLPIEGVIMPFGTDAEFGEYVITPQEVREFIKTAEAEIGIDGILFEINSPGGTPVASETIMGLIKNTTLPTVALIGDIAASGAYMTASAADTIIASSMSDVGGIGVTMSYLEESQKNEEEGLTFVELATGKFKDTGNPNRPLSEEERKLLEVQLEIIHDEFVRIVAENRDIETYIVQDLADGSTLVGQQALNAGLIDQIGGRAQAKEAFANALGTTVDNIKFCEYYPFLEVL